MGERLVAQLTELGWVKNGHPDIRGFAKAHGYDPTYLYRWKDGAFITYDNLRRVARDLQVSAAWLLLGPEAVAEVEEDLRQRAMRQAPKPLKQDRRRAHLPGLRLHDLRHTVATRLAHQRVDLATVGEILGHTPPYRETLRYYAHTSEDRLRTALAGLQTSQRRKK